jgi:hypothetical protein
MTKRFDDDDEDGKRILRDGETMTCRLMMKDSITKSPVQLALDATHAVKMKDAAILDAAHKPGFIRTAPVITDAMLARNAARAEYYDAYDKSISTAWERKAPVVTDAADPRTAYHNSVKEKYSRTDHYDAATAQAAKDAAYDSYDADLQQQSNRKCGSQF